MNHNWIESGAIWIISTILIPIITWFVSKKHFQKLQLKSGELGNNSIQSDILSKNLELYQRMLDDIDTRYQEMLKRREEEINSLQRELIELRKSFIILKEQCKDFL